MGIHDRAYYSEEPPRGLAPSWNQRSAVANIIILNVAVFIVNMLITPSGTPPADPGKLMNLLALKTEDAYHPWMWWRLLTYGFAHGGIQHVFWNMLGLWMLGRAVEELYGRAEFTRIYLGCVVACGAGWLLRHTLLQTSGSVIGASGATCCIEMLFVYNFPRVIMMIWGIVPAPAWVIGMALVLGTIFVEPHLQQIAYDVHLLGILFATGYYFLNWNFSRFWRPRVSFRQQWRRWTGPKLKVHSPKSGSATSEKVVSIEERGPKELRDEAEMDRILQKIHDRGPDSLSSSERKFMEKFSRQLRERRQNL